MFCNLSKIRRKMGENQTNKHNSQLYPSMTPIKIAPFNVTDSDGVISIYIEQISKGRIVNF